MPKICELIQSLLRQLWYSLVVIRNQRYPSFGAKIDVVTADDKLFQTFVDKMQKARIAVIIWLLER